MKYLIKINDFEGPFDLLLHLVKMANIDIYDININEITEQYFDYIHAMEELNIDIASEYLVMASTLMEIKSKSLLPQEKEVEESPEDEEASRDAFIQKLIEYQKYKEVTKNFKTLENTRRLIHTKAPEKLTSIVEEKVVNDGGVTIDDLMDAFTKFLIRKDQEKPLQTKITVKEYSIPKRKKVIREYLQGKGKVEFTELFEEYNKSYIIVTFLSILELAKENDILLFQEGVFDTIMIEWKAGV